MSTAGQKYRSEQGSKGFNSLENTMCALKKLTDI